MNLTLQTIKNANAYTHHIMMDDIQVGYCLIIEPEEQYDEYEELIEVDEYDKWYYLENIEIYAAHRNQGLGTQAMNLLSDMYFNLYFAPDTEDSQRLYERIGAEIEQRYYNDFGFAVDQGFGIYTI